MNRRWGPGWLACTPGKVGYRSVEYYIRPNTIPYSVNMTQK
jgi:hypothetical protein